LRWILDREEVELREQIGDGVTSVVFLGTYAGRDVAVKQMKSDPNRMSEKAKVNFDRELTILQNVRHPNLVEFFGIVAEQNRVSFVMEFCRGGTAFDLLHNSGWTLSYPQKLKCATDIASAMQYLHSVDPPVIHRDLKSLNSLLQNEVRTQQDVPVVKVTDFGLSKVVDADDAQACMTKAAGTCHWMAPEVFASNDYDRKADVYSFAMILYEIICQDVPFGNIKAPRLGLMIVRGKRPDMEMVPPDCPPFLRDLMVACWAQSPVERPDFDAIMVALRAGA